MQSVLKMLEHTGKSKQFEQTVEWPLDCDQINADIVWSAAHVEWFAIESGYSG